MGLRKLWRRIQLTALAVLLPLLLTSCASTPAVAPLKSTPLAAKCEHPLIDPRTRAGLAEAIRLYWGALEDCNTRNGYPSVGQEGIVAPTGSEKVTTTVTKSVTKSAPDKSELPGPLEVLKSATQK